MLREKSRLILQLHRLLDLILTGIAFFAAYVIRKHFLPDGLSGLSEEVNYSFLFLLILMIWYVVFNVFNVYSSYRHRNFKDISKNLVKAVFVSLLVFSLFLFILKIQSISRIMLGIFVLLDIVLLGTSKLIVLKTLRHVRRSGYNSRNLLIVGSKKRAEDAICLVNTSEAAGFKVLGCLETDAKSVGDTVQNGVCVIGTIDQLENILRENVVDELIFAMPLEKIPCQEKCLDIAENMGVKVRIFPDWQIHRLRLEPHTGTVRFEKFLGTPTLAIQTTPTNEAGLLIKSIFDYTIAGFALLLTMPLFIAISVAIKVTSRGPIFYIQERCGLHGRIFSLYKFRTMVDGADLMQRELESQNEMDGPVFKMKRDPRIVPYLGTFLRKTGLDELPQLINVLKGEMSIVGPRPPIPAEVTRYKVEHLRRLSMKPGLTCIWQIMPQRNHLRFTQWMKMDLEYIDNWSLSLDFKLILLTLQTMILRSGY